MDIVFFATVTVTSQCTSRQWCFSSLYLFFCNGSRCFFATMVFFATFPRCFLQQFGASFATVAWCFSATVEMVPYPFSFENRVSQM